jgi:hypothetical protein
MTMTGKPVKTSGWLSSALAIGLVIAEATWASLLINILVNSSPGPHANLPFWAFAVAAVIAVAVCTAIARLRWQWWFQRSLMAVVVIVGIALSAAAISQLSTDSATWWRVAFPWLATGHRHAVIAGSVWFVAVVVWLRGVRLGTRPPYFLETLRSSALGLLAFVGILAGRAAQHRPNAFRTLTGNVGWLLFVWLALTVIVLALVRQRELEQQVLQRVRSRPSSDWLVILAVPTVAVVVVASIIAVVAGPAAPAVKNAAVASWNGLVVAVEWLGRLLPASDARTRPVPVQTHGSSSSQLQLPKPASRATVDTLQVAGAVVAIVLSIALLAIAIIFLIRKLQMVREPRRPVDEVLDEERNSVFSWRHLLAQLRQAVVNLVGRMRSRVRRLWARPKPARPVEAATDAGASATSVRAAYRRVLAAAHTSGWARRPSETPREFQLRLAPILGPDSGTELDRLTALYGVVRYGEADETAEEVSAASAQGAVVIGALTEVVN